MRLSFIGSMSSIPRKFLADHFYAYFELLPNVSWWGGYRYMHSIYMSADPLGFPGVWYRDTMFCCSSPLLLSAPGDLRELPVWCNFRAQCQSRSLVPGGCFNQTIRRSCNGDSESERLLDLSLQILRVSHDGPLAKRLLLNTHQIHISDSETCSCRKQMFWWRLYTLIIMNCMYYTYTYYI